MALLAMVTYDTDSNSRSKYTDLTLESLGKTVDFNKHRLVVSDNGSCKQTFDIFEKHQKNFPFTVIQNGRNTGTANATNAAWKQRVPGESCAKIDNDIYIHQAGWVDLLEECIQKDPNIGIIGLKRRDLAEWPVNEKGEPVSENVWHHSKIIALPHVPGHNWLAIEVVDHTMGSCCLFNSKLLDKIGFLVQPGVYGHDDCLAAVRCSVAGFKSCFFPWISIDHLDPGGTAYQTWKERYAGEHQPEYNEIKRQYFSGERSIYEDAQC